MRDRSTPPTAFASIRFAALAALTIFACLAGPGRVLAWEAELPDTPETPTYFLAIDKERQAFLVMGRESPLKVLKELPCATGQADGDKLKEGDLRTPEGVYFVRRKLAGGLDYELYGDLAFTLDFPNPVDRARGKSGTGIWIHGRGRPIGQRETKGCVALNTEDLLALSATLAPGTPVIIASSVRFASDAGGGRTPAMLKDKVAAWAKSWQNRSPEFFAAYDAKRFNDGPKEDYADFAAQKRRVFASQPWNQVLVTDITALPGPDYWVTSFKQYYRAPNLTAQLVKRLYWQQDEAGAWRIIGNTEDDLDENLEPLYLDRLRQEVLTRIDAWRKAWLKADVAAYKEFYLPDAVQQGRKGSAAIMDHKRATWGKAKPRKVEISDLVIRMHQRGAEVRFRQRYADATGYQDVGQKTMILEPRGERWFIADEQWTEEKK
jgi:murein L,D-transpeptidase YafK